MREEIQNFVCCYRAGTVSLADSSIRGGEMLWADEGRLPAVSSVT
jgi:hypothetical protein